MGMGDGSEPICGNGIVEYGEDCDGDAGCDFECHVTPPCGNTEEDYEEDFTEDPDIVLPSSTSVACEDDKIVLEICVVYYAGNSGAVDSVFAKANEFYSKTNTNIVLKKGKVITKTTTNNTILHPNGSGQRSTVFRNITSLSEFRDCKLVAGFVEDINKTSPTTGNSGYASFHAVNGKGVFILYRAARGDTFAHELGHVLQLQHTHNSGSRWCAYNTYGKDGGNNADCRAATSGCTPGACSQAPNIQNLMSYFPCGDTPTNKSLVSCQINKVKRNARRYASPNAEDTWEGFSSKRSPFPGNKIGSFRVTGGNGSDGTVFSNFNSSSSSINGVLNGRYTAIEFVNRIYADMLSCTTSDGCTGYRAKIKECGTNPSNWGSCKYFNLKRNKSTKTKPRVNDLIIWKKSNHGKDHVAIVTSVTSDGVHIAQQNLTHSREDLDMVLPIKLTNSGYVLETSCHEAIGWLRLNSTHCEKIKDSWGDFGKDIKMGCGECTSDTNATSDKVGGEFCINNDRVRAKVIKGTGEDSECYYQKEIEVCPSGETCQNVASSDGKLKTDCLPGGETGTKCSFSENSTFPISLIIFLFFIIFIRKRKLN